MQVLFDPALDRCIPWPWASEGSLPGTPKALLGQVFVGEEGLLSFLEGLLGFAPPQATRLERQLAYHQALHQANSAERFYRESLAIDPLGTAIHLLEWRDTWLTLGWNRSNQAQTPPRLRDMLAIEFHCVMLPAGRGERLQRIIRTLEKQNLKIKVQTIKSPTQFHGLWAQLLRNLKAEVRPRFVGAQAKNSKSSLFHLQSYLTGQSKPKDLPKDDSLHFIEAPSEMLLGFYTANILAPWFSTTPKTPTAAIVSWDQSEALSLALMRQGLPRIFDGAAHTQGQGAQLLQFLLQIPWKPFDPSVVFSFLEHPLNPVPQTLRYGLTRALSEQAGYQGPKWKKAVAAYDEAISGKASNTFTAQALLDRWLKPGQWDGEVALTQVQDLCLQIKVWAQSEQAEGEQTLESVQQNCDSLLSILTTWKSLGHTKVSRLELNKLITDSRIEATQVTLTAQASPLAALSAPAGLLGPADRILLWGFHQSLSLKRSPWSAGERLALSQQGVEWPDQRQEIRDDRALAIQSMLMAREQLVVTIPLQIAGESCRQHPLTIALKRDFPQLPVLSVEQILNESPSPGEIAPHTEALEARPLPPIKKYWRIEPGLLQPREKESPSSMENLIYKPYNYVLRYSAALYPPKWRQAVQTNNLEGLVAHALIEHFFTAVWTEGFKASTWQGKTPEQWIEDETLRLIEERAAYLNQIERQSHRDYLLRTLKEALPLLVKEAQLSKASNIRLEEKVDAKPWSPSLQPPSQKGPLPTVGGILDLQWVNAKQQHCIIDVKWTRSKKKFHHLLQKNQQIQLAVYCAMLHTQKGQWSPSAYFVMPDPQLLTQTSDSAAFSTAQVPPARVVGSTTELWQDIQKAWHWRWKDLREGLIEVTTGEAKNAASEETPPPELAGLAIDLSDEQTEYEYKTLLGWAS